MLALAYVSADRRPAVDALFRLDAALGAVLSQSREPMIARIKLAWWREGLERLDTASPPSQPALETLAREVLPRGVTGAELSGLEEGWAVLLEERELGPAELEAYASARGGRLFRLAANLLGEAASEREEEGGRAWALADLARRSSKKGEAEAALRLAGAHAPSYWPTALRPLGMLAMLARRDAERGAEAIEPVAAPGRAFRMLRHRLTGR